MEVLEFPKIHTSRISENLNAIAEAILQPGVQIDSCVVVCRTADGVI